MKRLLLSLLLSAAVLAPLAAQASFSALEALYPGLRSPVEWDPRWPAELPPDAFALRSGLRAASVTVEVVEADAGKDAAGKAGDAKSSGPAAKAAAPAAPKAADPKTAVPAKAPDAKSAPDAKAGDAKKEKAPPYRAAWNAAGRAVAYPVFLGGSRYDLNLRFDASGRLSRVDAAASALPKKEKDDAKKKGAPGAMAPAAAPDPKAEADASAAKKAADAKKADAAKKGDAKKGGAESVSIALSREPGGDAEKAVYAKGGGKEGGDSEYSALSSYADRAEELRCDQDGAALSRDVLALGRSGPLSRLSYAEDGAAETAYSLDYDSGDRITRAADGEGSAEAVYGASGRVASVSSINAEGEATERRFQWDERGLLVSETELGPEGFRSERSYSYILNSRGDWTERGCVLRSVRFGALVAEAGGVVKRSIEYRR